MNQILFALFSLPIISIVFIGTIQFWNEMFGNNPPVITKPTLDDLLGFIPTPADNL